jgi:hypothetical protein
MTEAGYALFMQHGLDESRFFLDAFEYAAIAESRHSASGTHRLLVN